jgi:hypothetical protein
MVEKRPWERVALYAFETPETSLVTQYYEEIIENFQREQRRLHIEMINEKQNIQKDHAKVLLKKKKQWKEKAKEITTRIKVDK